MTYSRVYRSLSRLLPEERRVLRIRRGLERRQWFSPEELRTWQFASLKMLVRHAYRRVPYYRRLLRREGIHPTDLREPSHVQALPFLTREEVRAHFQDLIASSDASAIRIRETGGSTAQPVRFGVDKDFFQWHKALRMRSRGWYGVLPSDKTARILARTRAARGQRRSLSLPARISRTRSLDGFHLSAQSMQAFADMLLEWRPAWIRGAASSMAVFAAFLKNNNINKIRTKLVEVSAEKLNHDDRNLITGVFGCPVCDCYASREFGTIACECPEGNMHVAETRYLEIVRNGKPAAPGQTGEVVITSLHQYAMPFIRYKIGDVAVVDADSCPCGRGLPVLRDILGRTSDFIVTPEGHIAQGLVFAHLFRIRPEIARFQVYQPDIRHVVVRLVCDQPVDDQWIAHLRAEIASNVSRKIEIHIQFLDHIPSSPSGKYRQIISHVKPDFL